MNSNEETGLLSASLALSPEGAWLTSHARDVSGRGHLQVQDGDVKSSQWFQLDECNGRTFGDVVRRTLNGVDIKHADSHFLCVEIILWRVCASFVDWRSSLGRWVKNIQNNISPYITHIITLTFQAHTNVFITYVNHLWGYCLFLSDCNNNYNG